MKSRRFYFGSSVLPALFCSLAGLLGAGCTIQAPAASSDSDKRSSAVSEAEPESPSGAPSNSAGPSRPNATTQASCSFGEPNEEHSKAAKVELGRTYTGLCLQRDDADFFEFTAPSTPGYATVKVQNVGAGTPNVAITGVDNAELVKVWAENDGASVILHVGLIPGATYRVVAREAYEKVSYAYDLALSFTPFADPFEANDTRAQAKDIETGKVVQGIFAAGTKSWDDWFRVSLVKGAVTIRVDETAEGIMPSLALYDGDGKQLEHEYGTSDGGTVVIRTTVSATGSYYVSLGTAGAFPDIAAEGEAPASFTQPYKLSVTQ